MTVWILVLLVLLGLWVLNRGKFGFARGNPAVRPEKTQDLQERKQRGMEKLNEMKERHTEKPNSGPDGLKDIIKERREGKGKR